MVFSYLTLKCSSGTGSPSLKKWSLPYTILVSLCTCPGTLYPHPSITRRKSGLQTGDRSSPDPHFSLGLWVSILVAPHTQALRICRCPGDGIQGMGCCPRSSDHRLAVTGGCASRSIVDLCAPSSMLFCLLGASRQREARLSRSGEREYVIL